MSIHTKSNRELIKKEKWKLQIEEERLKKKKRLAELQQKISSSTFDDNERQELLFITNKQKYRKDLKGIKKKLKKNIKQIDISIIKVDAQKAILEELENQKKQIPQIEDIINSAKHILYTEKRIIQTIKPIISHLQENGFNTEYLDIAKILLETGMFTRGYFSKVWRMGKPNPVYFYFKQKAIIFLNAVLGFAQKYLPVLYKAVKQQELNQKLTFNEKLILKRTYKTRKKMLPSISFIDYIPELQYRSDVAATINASKKACKIIQKRKWKKVVEKAKKIYAICKNKLNF